MQGKQVTFLLSLFIIFLGTLFALPRKSSEASQGSNYEPAKIEILRGQVIKLDSLRPVMKMKMQTDLETIVVELGPSWYFLDNKFALYPKDRVAITGWRTMENNEPVFVASDIKKGGVFLRLRDSNGNPVWGNENIME